MNCAVNLVPATRLHTRTRLRRRRAWLATCAALGILLASAWLLRYAAQRQLVRLAGDVSALEAQRDNVQRRLVAIDARRQQILSELRGVALARRPQPWPQRLLALTRQAPAGVVLTSLRMQTRTADTAVPAETTAAAEVPTTTQIVQMQGFALEHADLIGFVHVLETQPEWDSVELVQATRASYLSGQAVMFEVSAAAPEGLTR